VAAGTWEPYVSPGEGTVVGDLRVVRALESPHLGRAVDVLAWLPPSYASSPGRAYGVLYLWDAQNLFDHATSLSGEWQVDETMTRLATEGLEWIVVGLAHGDGERSDEYTPWSTSFGVDGRGDATLALLCETVKPRVEESFRTLTGPAATAIGGSSLGGLMSLYALFARPDLFARALVMSPAFFFTEGRIFDWIEGREAPDARIWMDLGTVEAPHDDELERAYREGFDRMRELLAAKGIGPERLRTLVVEGAIHHESAWAQRLPDALRFLLR
jgi:predicted alpha/beta superfamily hydrolase